MDKNEKEGNYAKRIRQVIDESKSEEVFDGDIEKARHKSDYFGVGTVAVSHCDNLMAYSLDLKGSEYYTIYVRDLNKNKNFEDKIEKYEW